MACKDSDYTVVIAIMHCPHCTILVLKLTLVVRYKRFCSAIGHHRSIALFEVRRQYSSYEGPTKILTTQVWSLSFTDAHMPKLTVLAKLWVAVIMSCLPFGRHCSRSTERGCHVACALIGTNCNVRYGESQPGLQRGYEWFYSVLESTLNNFWSSLYIAIMVLTSCVIIGTNCHT